MKVNIISSIFGTDGHSRHGKGLANALNDLSIDVRIDSPKPDQWERYCSDFELNAFTKPFDRERTTIMIAQPQNWRMGLAEKPDCFFGYVIWEGDKIPEYWLEYLFDSRVDKIIVPSKHTAEAILNSIEEFGTGFGLSEDADMNKLAHKCQDLRFKIEIIPHGYDSSKFYVDNKKENKIFTFLANKGWSRGLSDRGGLQWLFKAYMEEFTSKDNVCLKVKINAAYNPPGWNMEGELAKIGITKSPDSPRLLVTLDNLNDDGLRKFYNEGDIFVTASMADAFNLPCIEAMACGLPVLTPNYGGQMDFVTTENGILIDKGEMGNFSDELHYEDVKWFKVDHKELRKTLRMVYESKVVIDIKSKTAAHDAKNWSWLESAKKIAKLL